jgi:hypothetical protein
MNAKESVEKLLEDLEPVAGAAGSQVKACV